MLPKAIESYRTHWSIFLYCISSNHLKPFKVIVTIWYHCILISILVLHRFESPSGQESPGSILQQDNFSILDKKKSELNCFFILYLMIFIVLILRSFPLNENSEIVVRAECNIYLYFNTLQQDERPFHGLKLIFVQKYFFSAFLNVCSVGIELALLWYHVKVLAATSKLHSCGEGWGNILIF